MGKARRSESRSLTRGELDLTDAEAEGLDGPA